MNRPLCAIAFSVLISSSLVPSFVWANHGPGTSGGASYTASGETLKQGKFDLSIREDYTQFQDINRAGAERRAVDAGGFDALKHAWITSAGLSYGMTDDLQLSAQIGYYSGKDFIDAESDPGTGEVESGTANPSGLTDLALTAKYRIIQGQPGNVALIGGLIVPTGRDNVRLDNGELLEDSSQPGTGAFAYQLGIAYSRFLTSRITTDASAIYTIRTPHDHFEVGDRIDLGLAFAYRLSDTIRTFPNYSVFVEANAVHLGKDRDAGEENPNSGGWTMYLTPGARIRFNQTMALTVAPSFPILQELEGEQIKSRFKVAVAFSFSF